jgi:long-subunit acyl-CoA synthetase (AMP-forming)
VSTVIQMLEETVARHGDRPALKSKRNGAWVAITWRAYRDEVMAVARGFIRLGLEPGGAVAIVGKGRREWFVADLAAIAAGGVPTGIYTTSTPEQVRYIADHAEAAVLVLENAEYLARLESVRGRLRGLRAVVLMEGEGGDGVRSWSELPRLGSDVPEDALRQRIASQKPEDLATLIYTSGTTGPPKGVMLSHRNLTWIGRRTVELCGLEPGQEVVCYLPLSHIAEQVVSLYTPLAGGMTTSFAESLDKLPETLREIRPHLFFGVPRVWEKIQAAMQAAGTGASPLRRRLVAWAKSQGLAGGYAEQRGESKPPLYGLARRLVFDKVRARLGFDRAVLCGTSAAPIARETLEYFLSLGIPVYEVYGMSECTGPATVSVPGRYRTGKAGVAIPGTEIRTAEDGEILMRGPHVFLGYFKDAAATAEALDEAGWLHSGDIGTLDAQGFLQVTDRKKELLITSGGKNIAPQVLETRLKQIPGVAHAVALGDRRNYVAALLTLDPSRLGAAATAAGSPARDAAEASRCPLFRAFVEQEIDKVNATLARYESIRRFTILANEFSVETGELTPTLKLKRRVVAEKYAAEIERLYG